MSFDIHAFRTELLTNNPLVRDIWSDKYRWKRPDGSSDEEDVAATRRRVVEAVYANDPDLIARNQALYAVNNGLLIPAGRVNAGAGTGRAVTLNNCYVLGIMQDSMTGIQYTISRGAFTLQQGGGIGDDFSPVRPHGAVLRRTGSEASGVIAFMDQQDGMCSTIQSAGERRGAMMGTLRCDHPDLWNENQFATATKPSGEVILTSPSFISAKRQKGRLTGFNVSVLVTDKFLDAVANDRMWDLGHFSPRADGQHVDVYNKEFPYDEEERDNEFNYISPLRFFKLNDREYRHRGDILPWYVYRRVPARKIWEDIMASTYTYAEPGVIYIDRVNSRNNLYYCEDIQCTNPCGEQPLPPDGCCCLSSVNLAFMVDKPFTPEAKFDFALMAKTTQVGVRFLDNVLDVSAYPLEAQRLESINKRRVGLGVTGFADALVQLGVTYGSQESVNLARNMSMTLRNNSYLASAQLADERGPFPMYDATKFCEGYNFKRLPSDIQTLIQQNGIRNGVLNTIAPNGTISIYTGNLASGHEPVFSFAPTKRNVIQGDGSTAVYESVPYSLNLFNAMFPAGDPNRKLPPQFVGAMDISVEAHVQVHAAWQEYIDASISKTINCPTDMNYAIFKGVYHMAYELGCKGCTTYRYDPSSGRGSVLSERTDDGEGVKAFTTDESEGRFTEQDHKDFLTAMNQGPDPGPYEIDFDERKFRDEQVIAETSTGGRTFPFSEDTVLKTTIAMYAGYNNVDFDYASKHLATDQITYHRWTDVAVTALEAVGGAVTVEVGQALASMGYGKPQPMAVEVMPAARVVEARRYRLKWPQTGDNWYITCTRVGNTPFEVFITTKDAHYSEWVQALSLLLTAVLRRGGDVRFLIQALLSVHSSTGGAFIADQHSYRPSVVAAIGGVLDEEFHTLGLLAQSTETPEPLADVRVVPVTVTRGQPGTADCCPQCGATPLVHEQGCERCLACSYNKCG